jgi:uncharacterized protein (TIGR02996 family)
MTDAESLINAVAADPDADAPRLVLADWYDEHGDPDRAAFIRAHVRLARLPAGSPELAAARKRVVELFDRCGAGWVDAINAEVVGQPPHPFAPRWAADRRRIVVPCLPPKSAPNRGTLRAVEFAGGLVGKVWLKYAEGPLDGLFARHPVTRVEMVQPPDAARWQMIAVPAFERVRTLGIALENIASESSVSVLGEVFASPSVAGVRRLAVSGGSTVRRGGRIESVTGGPAREVIELFCRSPLARRLAGLRLPVRPWVLDALAGYPLDDRLQEFVAGGADRMAAEDWSRLAEMAFRPTLRRLDLFLCRIGDEAAGVIARGQRWVRLTHLRLAGNWIGDYGAAELARCGVFPAVEWFDLSQNQIGDAGADALARSPLARRLLGLDLSGNRVSGPAAVRLAAALVDGPLRTLRLAGCPLGRHAAKVREILGGRGVL